MVLLEENTKFAAFYNKRSTDYYSNDYINYLRVFNINAFEPVFTVELSEN